MLSVMMIMAGGNIINDVYDRNADRFNKPGKNKIGKEIAERTARIVYWVVSLIGLGLGYFMGYTVGITMLGSIHLIAFFLLWMYSTDFKHSPLLGNLVVSLLSAIAIVVIPLFDVVPANRSVISEYVMLFYIFGAYALFAFTTTLIRELVKDGEDFKGDHRVGSKTLALSMKPKNYKLFILFIIAIFEALILWVSYYFLDVPVLAAYLLLLIAIPMGVIAYWIWGAKEKKDWNKASLWIKIVMLFGISSVMVFSWIG
jgi:4-hydroxybenzoate polyprenyltransferase